MAASDVKEIRELRLEQRDGRWVVICLYVNTAGQLIRYVKLADSDDIRRVREIGAKVPNLGENLEG
jgi:hypothetical protein